MDDPVSWTPEMRSVNLITEKTTKKIWDSSLRSVLTTLRKINFRYLSPQDFFEFTVPLFYHPFHTIRKDRECPRERPL